MVATGGGARTRDRDGFERPNSWVTTSRDYLESMEVITVSPVLVATNCRFQTERW